MRQKQRKSNRGFTIVELLLASTVFSVVVLVALSGFIEIGRLFYKGAIYTQNQQTARNIVDNVSGDLSTTTSVTGPLDVTSVSGVKMKYYCIGSYRYTFTLGKETNSSNQDHSLNFGVLRDKLDGFTPCANPFDPPSAVPIADNAAELLGNRMRLNAFCVSHNDAVTYGNLYTVRVDIATGDDKNLQISANSSPGNCGATNLAACNDVAKVSQYCASNSLSTSVAAISTAPTSSGPAPPSGGSNVLNVKITAGNDGDKNSVVTGPGIFCEGRNPNTGDCTETYSDTTNVTLTATPGSNKKFKEWKHPEVCYFTSNKNFIGTCKAAITGTVLIEAVFDPRF